MCGVAGLVEFKSTFGKERVNHIVSGMCELLQHRGPDANGIWASDNGECTLGHTRLAIIDLDKRSNQPMRDASNRYVVAFNGEIYNFQLLKKLLKDKGINFHTNSDTEVLIEGFSQWGPKLFNLLDGMFALVIYDTLHKTVYLARDRMGEKPLYIACLQDGFAFCSELKPLLTIPDFSPTVSSSSLFEFFSLRYVLDPNTIFEQIICVQPGTYTVVSSDGQRSERNYYSYDIQDSASRETQNMGEFVDELDSALSCAVQTRLVADVPVGAFLSSGIDSSLVCAIAAKKLHSKVRCFSAGFVGGKDNETPAAQAIAQHLGLPFEEYLVSADDLIQTASHFGGILDEPNGDRSCVPTYFLSRLIKSQVTVAVSGDGGDELFGGYGRYGPLNQNIKNPRNSINQYFSERLPVFPMASLQKNLPEQYHQFNRRVCSRFVSAFARDDLADIEKMRLLDAYSYLPGAVLAKVDRMSMRHSLEVRTPFFSPEVLNLSRKLPLSLCTDGKLLKVALREVLHRYLPQQHIRPVKQGFGMPGSFFSNYSKLFNNLANQADEVLSQWLPVENTPNVFEQLRIAARDNINSYWAWIVLGQWVVSLPSSSHRQQ